MNSRINSNKSDIDKIKNKLSGIEESGNASIYKTMFDLVRPIGDTYVQYPQQASPNELWGDISTWEVVNYDGAFFRAAGGNAAAFIEKSGVLSKQAGQNLSHTHSITHSHSITDPGHSHGIPTGSQDGHNGGYNDHGYSFEGNNWTTSSSTGISIDSADISISGETGYSGGNETRPQNYTIRIWKRTA